MTVALIREDKPLTSTDTPDTGLCAACPGSDACYMLTSANLRAAYVKGCRNDLARNAQTEYQANRRAKLRTPDNKDPDPNDEIWEKESPFDSDAKYSSYRPDSYCSICGEAVKAFSERGTVVECENCESRTVEAATQERLDVVLERYSQPRQREATKPEMTTEEKLELVGQLGMICDELDEWITRLDTDEILGSPLAARARIVVHRLEYLSGQFRSVKNNPTFEAQERLLELVPIAQKDYAAAREVEAEIARLRLTVRAIAEPERLAIEARPQPMVVYQQIPPVEPEPEPEPEYWPEIDELEEHGGPFYCQIAGHLYQTKTDIVIFFGTKPNPGRESQSASRVFVCRKHADVRKIINLLHLENYYWYKVTLDVQETRMPSLYSGRSSMQSMRTGTQTSYFR